MKKTLSILLCMCLLIAFVPSSPASANIDYDPIIKIGLAYGLNTRTAANLMNPTGMTAGYTIGYFDSATREFYGLFTTQEREITILKDEPMWVDSSAKYYDTKPSSYKNSIGCYHLEADVSFGSFGEVMAAAEWVNATGLKSFPAYVGGVYKLRIGEHLDTALASDAYEQVKAATGYELNIVGKSATCYTVTVTGTDRILFEFDSGKLPLGIQSNSPETWFSGYKYYGGFEYNRVTGGNITVINVIRMNDYIKGVVPAEMPSSWPLEALKVQAICAKCYTVNKLGRHKSQGFDLCNTTDCQAYNGVSGNANTNRAVDETIGIYATYQGKIIETYYHSSSGGYTEDVENIWNNYIPYLRGVEDTYLVHTNPYSFSITLDQITQILQNKSETTKKITDIYVSRYSPYGNVLELTAVEAGGNKLKFTSDKARTILNSSLTASNLKVQSHRYTINGGTYFFVNGARMNSNVQGMYAIGADGKVQQVTVSDSNLKAMTKDGIKDVSLESNSSGTYTISGTGSGHNIGMSQWGVHAMAEAGFSFDEIMRFYFTGITVEHLSGY